MRTPLDWLFDSYLSPTIPPEQHRTIHTLLESREFMGHIFWWKISMRSGGRDGDDSLQSIRISAEARDCWRGRCFVWC